jgi:restriction endonuclease S subunit
VAEKIRQKFLEQVLIEAIIGLPPNLFYGAGIPACILVLRPNLSGRSPNPSKPEDRRGRVLFINADAEFHAGRAQNYLRPEHIERIVSTFDRFEDVPGYARRVPLAEIADSANDWNLNIRRYVDNSPPPEPHDVGVHPLGGVPMAELEVKRALFEALGFDTARVFVPREHDPRYCDFAPSLGERSALRLLVDNDPSVQARAQALSEAFTAWWTAHAPRLADLPQHRALSRVRAEFLDSFVAALQPLAVLDRFKLAGVIATWWTDTLPTLTSESQRPDNWREATLSSIAEVRFSRVDKLTHSSQEPVRLCNYIDVYNNDYITSHLEFMRASATRPEIAKFRLQVGDVIITKDPETPDDIGIPAVVDYAAPDLVCGYHLGLIRPNRDEVDSTFLAKQLSHHRIARYFGRQANGLTRYGLPIGAVNNTPLWLPELCEQKAIGLVLCLVDETIAKTEAVIAKLKQVRAVLLHDLLTRGLNKHGQLRDPIAHLEHFQDSSLGRIPYTWRIGQLREVADIASGVTLGRNLNEAGTLELPYLRVANVQDGYLNLADVKTVRIFPGELDRFRLRRGDVLMNEGGDYDKLGRVTVWEDQIPVCLHQNHVFRVRCRPDVFNCYFLAAVSGSEIGKRYFLQSSKQSTNLASSTQRN